jgi:hypothetical protein
MGAVAMKKATQRKPPRRAPQLDLPGRDLKPHLHSESTQLALPGIEADCLLAFLALVGLLRSLEHARSRWCPRISWSGPPWLASLHVTASVSEAEVAAAALEGVEQIACQFNVFDKADVDFAPSEYRDYANQCRDELHGGALAAAICAEAPLSKNGKKLLAAPLVMMFGQGHQHFLSRFVEVSRNTTWKKGALEKGSTLQGSDKIAEALFSPWKRSDPTPAFRWDPEEDQRYALRFRSPSLEGAAPTMHGANRLACIGFLSYSTVSNEPHPLAVGSRRDNGRGEVEFVWPIWSPPISLLTLGALLVHPDVVGGRLDRMRVHGIFEIYSCRRIQNGKFLNVSRARPALIGTNRTASS